MVAWKKISVFQLIFTVQLPFLFFQHFLSRGRTPLLCSTSVAPEQEAVAGWVPPGQAPGLTPRVVSPCF